MRRFLTNQLHQVEMFLPFSNGGSFFQIEFLAIQEHFRNKAKIFIAFSLRLMNKKSIDTPWLSVKMALVPWNSKFDHRPTLNDVDMKWDEIGVFRGFQAVNKQKIHRKIKWKPIFCGRDTQSNSIADGETHRLQLLFDFDLGWMLNFAIELVHDDSSKFDLFPSYVGFPIHPPYYFHC